MSNAYPLLSFHLPSVREVLHANLSRSCLPQTQFYKDEFSGEALAWITFIVFVHQLHFETSLNLTCNKRLFKEKAPCVSLRSWVPYIYLSIDTYANQCTLIYVLWYILTVIQPQLSYPLSSLWITLMSHISLRNRTQAVACIMRHNK